MQYTKSVPIGFVAKFDDKILPNIVGVDIGCGVTTVVIPQTVLSVNDINVESCKNLDRYIQNTLARTLRKSCVDETIYTKLNQLSFKVDRLDYHATQLATLGGGNHFIEINSDEENIYISVHSGSRFLGQVVNKYHNQFLGFDIERYRTDRDKIITELKAAGEEEKISDALRNLKKECYTIEYLSGEYLTNYLNDVDICIEYAKLSRKIMLEEILNFMNIGTDFEYIDTTHNYIDVENRVIHKGSISAKVGEKVIIPINMRDGMIIGVGKSNEAWMNSAPHGAGRILSRNKAMEQLNLSDFKKQMEDVITFSVSKDTLDEAPDSYRSIDEIKEHVIETIDIVSVAKVLYNFKN